jgi:dephospho-CoA kinase
MTDANANPSVVALVGLSGVGKSKVVELIGKMRDFETVYFGGVVLAELKARGLDHTPAAEADVRESLRAEFGMAAMALKSLPSIEAALAAGRDVLIDGLYSYAELKVLREKLGERLRLIAIHARKSVRAERLAGRPVRPLTAEEMAERDKREIDNVEKAQPIALADFHVVNDGSEEMLADALGGCLGEIFGG